MARLLACELEDLGAQGVTLVSPGFLSHLVTGPKSPARRRGRKRRRRRERRRRGRRRGRREKWGWEGSSEVQMGLGLARSATQGFYLGST